MDNSLGIYIHIPFCKSKCTYCDFPSYGHLEPYYDRYVEALLKEIKLWAQQEGASRKRPIETIYFGGGTPTELSLLALEKILLTLQEYFMLTRETELSIESNPGEISFDYLKGLKALGFERLSFGVQALQDHLLTILGRIHNAEKALTSIEEAHRAGFKRLNIDFIYGLPEQTMNDLEETINIIGALPIDHISLYGLQLEKGTYLEKLVKEKKLFLPAEDLVDTMYDYIMTTLPKHGFERYEISNFAKNKSVSKHNLRYWSYGDYLGFGSGAHSFYDNMRRAKPAYVVPYCQAIEAGHIPYVEEAYIDEKRGREDFCFLGLRKMEGLNTINFEERFGLSFEGCYGALVEELVKKQLLERDKQFVRLTPLGAKYGNFVFSQFLD